MLFFWKKNGITVSQKIKQQKQVFNTINNSAPISINDNWAY